MQNSSILHLRAGISALCLVFSYAFLAAQGLKIKKSDKDSLFRPRWELGADVLSLFDKNTVPAASLSARRFYRYSKSSARAWRLRLGVNGDTKAYWGGVSDPYKDTYRAYEPYIEVGHEWRHHAGRHAWYYGTTLSGAAHRERNYFTRAVNGAGLVTAALVRNRQLGVGALVGYQYRLNQVFSLGFESAFSAYLYNRYKQENTGAHPLPYDAQKWERNTGIYARPRPFHTVQVFVALPSLYTMKGRKPNTALRADSALAVPRWELGFDLLPLFGKGNLPAANLFARRNYNVGNGRGYAWRFRAGLDIDLHNDKNEVSPLTKIYRIYEPFVSVGHEWQTYRKGFRWYFGMDVQAGYRYYDEYNYLFGTTDSIWYNDRRQTLKLGFALPAGIQFRLTDALSLGLESAFTVNVSRFFWDGKDSYYSTPGDWLEGVSWGGRNSLFTTRIIPFHTIHLIYSFKNKNHEKYKNNI